MNKRHEHLAVELAADPVAFSAAVWPVIHAHKALNAEQAAAAIDACTADLAQLRDERTTETITLDLGEWGEVQATVEYEGIPADIDGSGRRDPAYLIVTGVRVPLLGDVLEFVQSLHPDALGEIEARVEEKLRRGE